jgi:Flp pilus assembly pilin Flp
MVPKWSVDEVINRLFKKNKKLSPKSGATLIEYVLLVSMISITLVGAFRTLGGKYFTVYNKINNNLEDALK